MEEKEQIPAGIITMLLKGYVDTIAFQRKIICAALFGWAATAIAFIVCRQVTRNEHTAEEHAGLVTNFNATFFQRGIGRSEDNTTAGRNLRAEICKRLDQLSDSYANERICQNSG